MSFFSSGKTRNQIKKPFALVQQLYQIIAQSSQSEELWSGLSAGLGLSIGLGLYEGLGLTPVVQIKTKITRFHFTSLTCPPTSQRPLPTRGVVGGQEGM